jgi:serine/threonine protein kinase, bacterial
MDGHILRDRYKIIRTLGAGGMGKTFVAEDTKRPGNPECVVKLLKPANSDPDFLVMASRLFTVEAEMLEQLKHNQIPQLLAYFEQDGNFYLVQEFIDGQPLSAELPLGQRWSETQVKDMLKAILPVLEFIHAQGVIHRDIKPDNIVRRRQDGKLVLIDFGAVKQIQMQQTMAVGQMSMTVAIGTPGYMPTEQSSGKPRPNSDIYALGMIGIQALTGLWPAQLREDEDGEVIWRDQAQVSEELATVLKMMTKHYFKHRYQTATEVLQALAGVAAPSAATNVGYTPTQQVGNDVYTPTAVVPSYNPTVASPTANNTVPVGTTAGQQIEPVKAVASPVNTGHQETPNKKNFLLGIGGILGVLAFILFIISQSKDNVNPTSNSPASSVTSVCSSNAEITGSIRSEPSSQAGNETVIGSGRSLPITGTKTEGGWIQVKQSDKDAWVYSGKISNFSQLQSQNCFSKTVDDSQYIKSTPKPKIVDSPSPTTSSTSGNESSNSSKEKEAQEACKNEINEQDKNICIDHYKRHN